MHYATQTIAGQKSAFRPIKMVEISVATSTITMKFMKWIDSPNFSKVGRKELEFPFLKL
jgi:hypothetical protein